MVDGITLEEFNIIFNKLRTVYGEESLLYTDEIGNSYLYYLKTSIITFLDGTVDLTENVTFLGREFRDILSFIEKDLRIKKIKRILGDDMERRDDVGNNI